MTFKVDKLFVLPEAGNLKAFCDVVVDDVLVIRGVRIFDGKNGLFVGLPREQGKDGKWFDQVLIRSAEVYEDMAGSIMDAYNKSEDKQAPGTDWGHLI